MHATARNFSKIIIYALPKKYYCILTLLFGWNVSAVGHKWNKFIIWNGQSIFHLEILLKSFQNYQPFFFFLSKGHWPYTRQSMSVNPPFLLLCFKDKEIWSLYFFCLRVIFLCFWQNTYSSVSDAILKCSLAMAIRQIDLFFFFFFYFISNGSQVWVMSTIKISLILARLVQLFSITFFI